MQMSRRKLFSGYCSAIINSLTAVARLWDGRVIGAISFYASTLARNTLQALAPAVLGIGAGIFSDLLQQSRRAILAFICCGMAG